jgi:hypothetical protein
LLFEGRNITADAAEDCGAVQATKGSGNLLVDFDYLRILLCLIVRISHWEVPHKQEHRVPLNVQTFS